MTECTEHFICQCNVEQFDDLKADNKRLREVLEQIRDRERSCNRHTDKEYSSYRLAVKALEADK